MLKKLHLLLIAILIIASSVQAKVELNPTHPDTYTVVKGDTLWDISARFLKSPWVWPEVWHANPHIENPHLIYPGDILSLVYVDGEPTIRVDRGHPTVKLGPKSRTVGHNDAIPTIPLSDIKPFLQKLRILTEEEIAKAPYVVAIEDNHLLGARSGLLYVRNLEAKQGDKYAVVRPTIIYRDVPVDFPWKSSPYADRKTESLAWKKTSQDTVKAVTTKFWKEIVYNIYWDYVDILGYEVEDIGTVTVALASTDDITTMEVKHSIIEIRKGDLILPLNDVKFNAFFQPKGATTDDDNIRIVALNNAHFRSGKWQIVAISRGSKTDISVGDVFDVYRPEHKVRDEVMYPKNALKTFLNPYEAMVTLPEEFLANIMIFKTFENISYAIIVEGNRPIKLFDLVRAP